MLQYKYTLIIFAIAFFSSHSIAQDCKNQDIKIDTEFETDMCTPKNYSRLGAIGGIEGGAYNRFLDILSKKISDNPEKSKYRQSGHEDFSLLLERKCSNGSLDTLRRIRSLENAGLGIIQSDILITLEKANKVDKNEISSFRENIKALAILFDEEIHLLAKKDSTQEISDLKGKAIFAGSQNSGSYYTASYIFSSLFNDYNIKVEHNEISYTNEIDKFLKDQSNYSAIFIVGSQPLDLFQNISEDYHFINITHNFDSRTYEKTTIKKNSYPQMKIEKDIDTLSVKALLVGHAFGLSTSRTNCQDLYRIRCTQLHEIKNVLLKNKDSIEEELGRGLTLAIDDIDHRIGNTSFMSEPQWKPYSKATAFCFRYDESESK